MSEVVRDVLCLGIPEEIDPRVYMDSDDPEVQQAFTDRLLLLAYDTVWAQWPLRRPKDVEFNDTEWLITNRVGAVQEFQPAHDCAECQLGSTRAEAFLREHPGRWVAMANLTYTVRWT